MDDNKKLKFKNTVDILESVLSISKQQSIKSIAYEACYQSTKMLQSFASTFIEINKIDKTGHVLSEYQTSTVTISPQWYKPIPYQNFPNIYKVIKTYKSFQFNKHEIHLKSIEESKLFNEFAAQNILVVPILTSNDLFGILLIWDHNLTRKFTKQEIAFIELLANNIGLVVEREKLMKDLKQLALKDELTNIFNRRAFNIRLKEEKSRSDRYNNAFSIIFLDLNDFKIINDNFGHQVGDKTLQIVASIINKNIREPDCLARIGGDEFAIIIPETKKEEAKIIANNINRDIVQGNYGVPLNQSGLTISVSYGIVEYPNDADNLDQLFKIVDSNMYKNKNIKKANHEK